MLEQVFATFSDATVYFIMGAIGTGLFVIRVILMLIFGMGHGGDFDVHMHADAGADAHDAGFSLFSMLSMMSFMMGAGWMGLLCRTEWGLGTFASAAAASAFGFALMLMSSGGMYAMRRFQQFGGHDVRSTIGKTGRVYLTVPSRGDGNGQVEVTVDGCRMVLSAVSTAGKLQSFSAVKVIDVRDDGVLVVESA